MTDVLTLAGSPSHPSRSSSVLDYARAHLEAEGVRTDCIAVRDLPAEDLIYGNYNSAAIRAAATIIAATPALIVATPVYKAAYSGVLKSFLDLLPDQILQGKVVLPIMTGGSMNHFLAVDYALRPVLAVMGAAHILNGVYLVDQDLQIVDGSVSFTDPDRQKLHAALAPLISAVRPAMN